MVNYINLDTYAYQQSSNDQHKSRIPIRFKTQLWSTNLRELRNNGRTTLNLLILTYFTVTKTLIDVIW